MDVDRLGARVQAEVDAGRMLGAALAVVEGDRVVYARGFGVTSVEPDGTAVTPTTLFAAASLTKTILATAVMRLVERDLLDLDAPVLRYLPGFAFSDPVLGARVTLRHLLSHTSGLATGGKDRGPPDRDALARFVHEQLSRYAFVAEPGRVHLYSNTAICLAGYVAEVVTGTPGRDLVAELVFGPLGMTHSTYDHAVAMTYRVALAHQEDDEGQLRAVHRWPDNRSGEPAGFAITPVLDLAHLARVHLNRGRFGGEQFLSPASIDAMHTAWADRRVRAASHPVAHMYEGYGLGLMLGRYRGERLVRHGGILQSFDNYFQLFPEHGRGFVLLTNHSADGAADCVFALHDALLGLPEGDAAARAVLIPVADPAPDRDAWPRYAGTYLDVPRGRLATVAPDGGGLDLTENGRVRRLLPVSPGAYFYDDEDEGIRVPVEFLPEAGRPTEHLFVGGNPYRRHVPGPGFAPDPAAWPRFVGDYADPSNLGEGAVIRVRTRAGWLRIADDWTDDQELVPFGPTSFLSTLGLVEFEADGQALAVGGATRHFRS